MSPRYPSVAQRTAHRCEYCRAPEAIFNLPFEVEHIILLSQGGDDTNTNLALACRACNLYKSDWLMGVDEVTQTEVRLFHPRQDSWEIHFQINTEAGVIQGLTNIGRASVMRLQMNNPAQVLARLRWMQLGLFP